MSNFFCDWIYLKILRVKHLLASDKNKTRGLVNWGLYHKTIYHTCCQCYKHFRKQSRFPKTDKLKKVSYDVWTCPKFKVVISFKKQFNIYPQRSCTIFLKMDHPRHLLRLFFNLFQTNITILQQIYVKKCACSIGCKD